MCPSILSRNQRVVAVTATIIVALGGCASPSKPAASSVATSKPTAFAEPSPQTSAEPCAARLHDVCGALLLYYFTYQRLPVTLHEINTFPGADETVPLTCPTSGLPYVYNRDGIELAEKHARVIVYDPTPAHGGRRLAIKFSEPGDDKAIVAEVVALPETFFLLRPPIATTLPTN